MRFVTNVAAYALTLTLNTKMPDMSTSLDFHHRNYHPASRMEAPA